jgi:hypothetical protein
MADSELKPSDIHQKFHLTSLHSLVRNLRLASVVALRSRYLLLARLRMLWRTALVRELWQDRDDARLYSWMRLVLVSSYNVPLGTVGEKRCEPRHERRVSGKQHAPSALPPGNKLVPFLPSAQVRSGRGCGRENLLPRLVLSFCVCFFRNSLGCSAPSSFLPLFRCRPFYCSSLSKCCIDCVSHLFCTESRSPITAGKGRRPVKSACRRRGHYQL